MGTVYAAVPTGTPFAPGGGVDDVLASTSTSYSLRPSAKSLDSALQSTAPATPAPTPAPQSTSFRQCAGSLHATTIPATATTITTTTTSTLSCPFLSQHSNPSRKRPLPSDECSTATSFSASETENGLAGTAVSEEPMSSQCPRVQTQPLCLPRMRSQTLGSVPQQGPGSASTPCQTELNIAKANFVDCLVDTAAVVIESIWPPPPPGSTEYIHRQKGLPLRTFIQETLKRSRSSYSTLQTALFYLYKIRNKVPCTYLKRRQDQLCNSQSSFAGAQPAAYAAGLVTPPASPHHFQSVPDFASNPSQDYFSSRYSTEHRPVAPSPLSSTCSMTSASPASISGYSPTSTASPASSTSSPSQSSSTSPNSTTSPKSVSSASNSSSSSTTSHAPNQSNRIIYCGRRTFLAALMVASKYLQDRNYSNKAWAKISGLSIKEINANELIFLKLIDYSLFVSHETFMRWTALLVAHGQEATRRFLQATDASSTSSTFVARAMSTPALVLNSSHIRYAHAVKSMESLTGLMSVPTTAAPALPTSTDNSTLTAVLSSATITGITGKDLGYTGFAGSGVGGVTSAMVMTPVSPPSSEPDEDQRLVLEGGSVTEDPRQAKIARTNSYPPLSQSKRTGSSLVC